MCDCPNCLHIDVVGTAALDSSCSDQCICSSVAMHSASQMTQAISQFISDKECPSSTMTELRSLTPLGIRHTYQSIAPHRPRWTPTLHAHKIIGYLIKTSNKHATMCSPRTLTAHSRCLTIQTSSDEIQQWKSEKSWTKWSQRMATPHPTRSSRTIHSSAVYICQPKPLKFFSIRSKNVKRYRRWGMTRTPQHSY